jgi:hypothetical protein
VRGRRAVLHAYRDEREAQRPRHGLGDRRQHLVRLPRRDEPVAKPAQRRGGIVTVAVDELVDVSNVFMKLQVGDRATAIVRAREAGLGGG